ncbi:hypothetical protein [Salinibacillus kushneri]|nr:hypothetical protein [Salinibacillus kushneri]
MKRLARNDEQIHAERRGLSENVTFTRGYYEAVLYGIAGKDQ